jgi:hypothetical protein
MPHSAIVHLTVVTLLFAGPVFATSRQSQSPDTPSALTAQTTTQSSSKVWTNDNIGSAGDGLTPSPAAPGNKPVNASRPKPVSMRGRNAKWYGDQIAALEARIPPIDAQIVELQSALDGKATGDGKTSQRPRYAKIDQWPAELKELQGRRQTIVEKIDGLRDEARHNGISTNTLP